MGKDKKKQPFLGDGPGRMVSLSGGGRRPGKEFEKGDKREMWAELIMEDRERRRDRDGVLRRMRKMPFDEWYKKKYPSGPPRHPGLKSKTKKLEPQGEEGPVKKS